MEHALHILHYTLNPAVGVQLGLGEQPFFIGYAWLDISFIHEVVILKP